MWYAHKCGTWRNWGPHKSSTDSSDSFTLAHVWISPIAWLSVVPCQDCFKGPCHMSGVGARRVGQVRGQWQAVLFCLTFQASVPQAILGTGLPCTVHASGLYWIASDVPGMTFCKEQCALSWRCYSCISCEMGVGMVRSKCCRVSACLFLLLVLESVKFGHEWADVANLKVSFLSGFYFNGGKVPVSGHRGFGKLCLLVFPVAVAL